MGSEVIGSPGLKGVANLERSGALVDCRLALPTSRVTGRPLLSTARSFQTGREFSEFSEFSTQNHDQWLNSLFLNVNS